MDTNQYPCDGMRFCTQKEKRSEKAPDYSGMLTLEMEVARRSYQAKRRGHTSQPKMNLVGWKKLSKSWKSIPQNNR